MQCLIYIILLVFDFSSALDHTVYNFAFSHRTPFASFYAISFLWYGPLGLLVTIFFGSIVSAISNSKSFFIFTLIN